jgi:hypothetical protein
MATTKTKGRIAPQMEIELLTESFEEQLSSGMVRDAIVGGYNLACPS